MFGFHLILDISDCNVECIRDEVVIREFLNVLLDTSGEKQVQS